MTEALGESRVALPTVLLFDPGGCLQWAGTDLKSSEWKNTLVDKLAQANQVDCESTWPIVAQTLVSEGVRIEPDKMTGHHVLIWYGSTDLCPPCRDIKASVWEEIKALVPTETVSIVLDWQ